MELSFTQGRWNNERWGVGDPIAQLAAVGVELTAFPEAEVDSRWGNLTHALSGLFCASINFLESPTTFLEPWFSWRPEANRTGGGGAFDAPGMKRVVKGKKWSKSSMTRYGALPREALCTENLTPWLTLLPCRGKAGLTTLLDRQFFVPIEVTGSDKQPLGMVHTTVNRHAVGANLDGCFAKAERLDTLQDVWLKAGRQVPACNYKQCLSGAGGELGEALGWRSQRGNRHQLRSPAPSRVLASSSGSLLLEFEVGTHSELDLGITWRAPVDWSPARGQFYTSRYLVGSGNARGSIVISFRANDGSSRDCYSPGFEAAEDDTEVCSFVWPHATGFVGLLGLMRFTPAEDCKAPAAVEIALRVSIAT